MIIGAHIVYLWPGKKQKFLADVLYFGDPYLLFLGPLPRYAWGTMYKIVFFSKFSGSF
jgi:hypothetical protein